MVNHVAIWFLTVGIAVTAGCGKPNTIRVAVTGSTQHKIPGDSTQIQAAFSEVNDDWQYVVLAYGRESELKAEADGIYVDGERLAVPPTGKVFVLDPELKLHETTIDPKTLKGPLWEGGDNQFFSSPS